MKSETFFHERWVDFCVLLLVFVVSGVFARRRLTLGKEMRKKN